MPDPRHATLTQRAVARPHTDWRWIAGVGLLSILATGVGGALAEGWLLGWSTSSAFSRVEDEVRTEFEDLAAALRRVARSIAREHTLIQQTTDDPEIVRDLFGEVSRATSVEVPAGLAVTVYGGQGSALAWSGRPSEIPLERIFGEPTLFVAPGPLGLRLVYVEPVIRDSTTNRPGAPEQIATVAAECVLSVAQGVRSPIAGAYTLPTTIANVSLRVRSEGDAPSDGRPDSSTFLVGSAQGEPLLEVEVPRAELEQARVRLRRTFVGVILGLVAVTGLLLIGPLLDVRARARRLSSYLAAAAGTVGLLVFARLVLWLAVPPRWAVAQAPLQGLCEAETWSVLRSPVDFLLNALLALALVAVAGHSVSQVRLAARRWRWDPVSHPVAFTLVHLLAGLLVVAVVQGHERFLRQTIDCSPVDVLQLSLSPWAGAGLALAAGLVVTHAAIVWAGVVVLLLAAAVWRLPRSAPRVGLLLVCVWVLPALLWLGRVSLVDAEYPVLPALLVVAACVVAASLARRIVPWYRHTSQAARLLAAFVAILVPAITLYPSVAFHADHARRRLVERQYATQAANHPQELQTRLSRSLTQIDATPGLDTPMAPPDAAVGGSQTDRAFLMWQQTELAEYRLTSAVELYGPDGGLVSRFALNLPEYTTTASRWQGRSCRWEVSGEASRFGAVERRLLHAERGICSEAGTQVGAIVVHVMLDYGVLPFLPSQSPYFEFVRSGGGGAPGGLLANEVELVIYGWGRLPIYSSRLSAWPLDEDLFARIYASRTPFWTTLSRGGTEHRVYFHNNRAGIYALGYPARRPFDVFLNLAELAGLAGIVYLALCVGAAFFSRVTRRQPRSGRHLLQEVRQSFYRKLFLAFVAASVVPVIILAVVIRAYFTTLLAADIEAEAARTAAVARRVIEESVALQQQGTASLASVSDDVMVWISNVIDQDVNIFDGSQLIATSERDLFASGLLPTRTPDDVYRAIGLQRLPNFIGRDAIGDHVYMVAAAPVRLGGRDAILTVPLGLRQQETDRETEEFDRGVYLAGVLFVLLGAGIGFSMAERIGDPVQRLTRATRRIARGDLDARVAVKSVDELQRLVEAFNGMASELSQQRDQLERTHRLEAWAEMARQVAHEIKNPLTPIQLSAEHLQRVHADRGTPLSPVLDDCVRSILKQVRLLRQIASEFSSFASSPTARPAATAIGALVEEIVEPYRAGLAARVELTVETPRTPIHVLVDATLLGRALTNIIENALHAMPGRGTLSIRVHEAQGSVRVTTADTGVGMEAEALERIFEPYFSTRASGTGLGLTIAKRNVELNGGTISVTSEMGRGTTVTVSLPVVADDHDATTSPPARSSPRQREGGNG